jgi:hypothetical protein
MCYQALLGILLGNEVDQFSSPATVDPAFRRVQTGLSASAGIFTGQVLDAYAKRGCGQRP